MNRSSDPTRSVSTREPLAARDAKVVEFTKVLPGWLRRCGVQRADLDDAVQEALAAALVKLRECPGKLPVDDATARTELMRIVSNVALRIRRQAQREGERYLSVANIEMPTLRDEEEWLEARVVILAALDNLDEPARALIYAHEIEGQTYAEIAATLKVKEDAAEKRVVFAKERLRAQVECLRRVPLRTHLMKNTMLLGLGFDSFDRAVFGAVHEVLHGKSLTLGLPKTHSFVRPTFPTSVLVGALALAPISSPPTVEEAVVPRDTHVSSVEVPGAETGLAVNAASMSAVTFIAFSQGCASTPSTTQPFQMVEQPAAVESPRVVEPSRVAEPPRVETPNVETQDLSEEEKARRERWKVWGGTNIHRFDDPVFASRN